MKKRLLKLLTLIPLTFNMFTFPTFAESVYTAFENESVFGEWQGSGSYNAYYKTEEMSEFVKLDSALIRTDGNGGYRVDALGIKGGVNCTIKVVPVTNGTEDTASAFEFENRSLKYDRSGYAFFNSSVTPGAYLADGTLPSNADVIYVNSKNIDSVSLYGQTGLKKILESHAKQTRPLVIRIIGQINASEFSALDSNKMVETKGTCGLTIEGVGTDACIYGWGFKISSGSDTEFRNLRFSWNFEDALETQNSTYIWIHDNDFTVGHQDNPKEADKDHGDGSCDAKRSDFMTISYNHFNGTAKTCLLGSSANSREDVGHFTYHHNFFENAEQRLPRVRWHDVHIYNNYYKNVGYDLDTGSPIGYGVGATCNCSIFAENNYFENSYRPFLTSDKNCGSLSANDGGVIKAYGNYYDEKSKATMEEKDRFEASSKDQVLTAADYTCTKGGWTYDNFDTSDKFYTKYYLEEAEDCIDTVKEYAGVQTQTALTLTNDINGSDSGSSGTGGEEEQPTPTPTEATLDCDYYYDFPSSGSTATSFGGKDGVGTYFTSNKTISSSNQSGSVTVNGKEYSYTGAGKFANNGTITFTAEEDGVLTIVATTNGTTARTMKITNSSGKDMGNIVSGAGNTASAGSLSLSAYTYTITNKGGGEAAVFYIGYKNNTISKEKSVAKILKYVNDPTTLTNAEITAHDINKDGKTDLKDAIALIK